MLQQATHTIYVAMAQNGLQPQDYTPVGVINYNKHAVVGGFSYMPKYAGPPLDPVNLNYRSAGTRVFSVNPRVNPDMLHRVFMDYMPGKWGMKVLMTEHPQTKTMKAVELFHWFGSRSVGALSFFVKRHEGEKPLRGIQELDRIRAKSLDFYMGRIPLLNEPGVEKSLTAHGGARPKVSFKDEQGDWIVKFNLELDGFSCARMEAATSSLAKECGITVPESKAVRMPSGEDVLFVRRFDRTETAATHRITAFSILGDSVRTQDAGDYVGLFEALKKISCDYEREARELLRRLMFNVAVNNTDDHLRNFEFIKSPCDEGDCYRLSPMFDCVPVRDPYPHVTSLMHQAKIKLDETTVKRLAERIGVKTDEALAMRAKISGVVSQWRTRFEAAGVPGADCAFMATAFTHGLKSVHPEAFGPKQSNDVRVDNRASTPRPTPGISSEAA